MIIIIKLRIFTILSRSHLPGLHSFTSSVNHLIFTELNRLRREQGSVRGQSDRSTYCILKIGMVEESEGWKGRR